MVKKESKCFGMFCICFFMLLMLPLAIKAEERVEGGATYEDAVEIEWGKEYTATSAEGWFKAFAPENLLYVGAGYDEFSEVVAYDNKREKISRQYVARATYEAKLGKWTSYWDTSSSGRMDLEENSYYFFKVSSSKAETCKFKVIYGTRYSTDNRKIMQLKQNYMDSYYMAASERGRDLYCSNYQFTAAETGNYKVIVNSVNGRAQCEITYKDGIELAAIDCKENQTIEEIIPVTQGLTYYIKTYATYMDDNMDEATQITFQVSNAKVSAITLDNNAIDMDKGEQIQLSANVAPENAVDKTITYISSDTTVATVTESGLVTAIRGGNATITASANDGSGIQAECSVTVKPKLATRLELSDDSIEEELATFEDKKDCYQLKATVYPTDADDTSVTYTSSDTSVVSVNKENGLLTLKKSGTAVITCRTNDGSNLTKTCQVVLKQISNTKVSAITLNNSFLYMNKGEQIQLLASVAPENAVNKSITYISSNPAVASVAENGVVTAIHGGNVIITANANDGSGVQAVCSVSVTPKLATRLELDVYSIDEDLETFNDEKYYYQLKATVYPVDVDDTSVTYTSNDTSVVSVNQENGLLTLKKPGTAVITCRTNDGSNLMKTCQVVLRQSHLFGYKITIDNIKYKVLSDTTEGGTVAVCDVSNKKLKSYTVPGTILIDGYTYEVIGVQDGAFKNCKKAISIVLGNNVRSIGKEAFYNCKKLKNLTINSKKLKTVGENSFKNMYSKAKIKVPSSKISKYKKLMQDKGQKNTVKIKRV